MSKSGVFAHFGSREQLQLALLESVGMRFVEFVKAPALREPRGLPRLRKMTERWCEWSRAHRSGCVLLSAAVEYDGRRDGRSEEHTSELQSPVHLYTLSLHDALPICSREQLQLALLESVGMRFVEFVKAPALREPRGLPRLRKMTERWCEWSRAHRSGCVLLSAAVEYDGRRDG